MCCARCTRMPGSGGSTRPRAKALKGVVAVLTGADLKADGIKPIPPDASIVAPHRGTAETAGRRAGQSQWAVFPDAVCAACGRQGAPCRRGGGARRSRRRWRSPRTRPSWSRSTTSRCRRSPTPRRRRRKARALLWDGAPSNIFLDAELGDAAATDKAFADAAHVVRLDSWVQRVTGVPMEARTAVGHYDKASGRYFLHAGSGGVVRQKNECAAMLGVSPDKVQVVARDIGGNFGTKNSIFPEFPLVLWASKRVGRPVKWVCERERSLPHRLPGPRPCRQGRAGARRARKISRDARLASEQYRLVRRFDRAAAQRAHHLHRHLSHPGSAFPRLRRAQQHHVHHALSQRRAAGDDVSHGAAVRSRRRQDRHRPRLDQAAQHHSAEEAAVHDRARHQIRQRRIRTGDGQGAVALGMEGVRPAPARVEEERQAARHRARQLHRMHHGLSARVVEDHRASRCARRRRGRGRHRHAVERAGARDELCAMRQRLARRAVRADQAHAGRHRHRAGRRRLAFGPLHALRLAS